jgi:antitoxin component YwqK of YwqJK toxin-antitoxin module
MSKVKLFSIVIMIEILIIIALLVVFFYNWKIVSPDTYKISSSISGLIYSEGTSTPFTGRMQDTIDNKMLVEFDVVDGIKQGEFVMSTLDGNFAIIGHMKKNKNDGNWKYFYNNGQLECSGDFNNDHPVGKWIWFYENGSLKCEGTYINGKAEGKWTKYNIDGTLNRIINYCSGEVVNFVPINNLTKV